MLNEEEILRLQYSGLQDRELGYVIRLLLRQEAQLETLIHQGEQMSTSAVTQAQAMSDLAASDVSIKAAVAQILQVVISQTAALSAASGDPAKIESIAQDLSAQATSMLAAVNPPAPAAEPTPTA